MWYYIITEGKRKERKKKMTRKELEKRYYELLPVRKENEKEFKEICDKLMVVILEENSDVMKRLKYC